MEKINLVITIYSIRKLLEVMMSTLAKAYPSTSFNLGLTHLSTAWLNLLWKSDVFSMGGN